MQINISTPDLKEALSLSQNTLGTNSDITSHFVFVKDGTNASVLSCTLPRTFSKVPLVGATVTGNDSFTIEGKRIMQAISAVSGVLEIKSDEEGTVSVSLEKGNLALPSLDSESFPPWLTKLENATLMKEVPASILYDAINSLKSYVSVEDNRRPELAMLYVNGGKAYACDGFGMSVAQHDDLTDLDLKIHSKDLASLLKFLKSNEGLAIEVLSGDQCYFFRGEDGSVFGVTDLPHTFPQTVLSYAEAFDWTPQKVWAVTKGSLSTAIKFLRAGADTSDCKVLFTDEGDLLPPSLSMRPSNTKGSLSYSLDPVSLEEDSENVVDPGEAMFRARQAEAYEGDDIKEFGFNYLFMTRAMESLSENIFIGCNQENNKGYMVFKAIQPSGLETVSVVGWMV